MKTTIKITRETKASFSLNPLMIQELDFAQDYKKVRQFPPP